MKEQLKLAVIVAVYAALALWICAPLAYAVN